MPAVEIIRRLLGREEPETHDYTQRYWGHNYVFTPLNDGMRGRMQGWGHGIRKGDYLLLQHPDGGSSRYRVETISYYADPPDMWSAEVSFAPRPAAA